MAITNFAAEVLADGPIGFWRLGEAPGSVTAADSSGNGNNGSCSGTITFCQPCFHCGALPWGHGTRVRPDRRPQQQFAEPAPYHDGSQGPVGRPE